MRYVLEILIGWVGGALVLGVLAAIVYAVFKIVTNT